MFYHVLTFTLHHLCDLKHKPYQLLTVGSTDIKQLNVAQASQHLVYGQQSRYKHVSGIRLHTHLFNANSNNDK